MLWTIGVILLVCGCWDWSVATHWGVIQVLLVIALIVVVIQVIQGRRRV